MMTTLPPDPHSVVPGANTLKDACGAARAVASLRAPRSLTVSAPGAPIGSWSGRRNGLAIEPRN
jgi:hypothetical protein